MEATPYKLISERFPIEFEKAVNQALAEGYQPLGAPFGWRDSLHQAVIKPSGPTAAEKKPQP